MLKQIKLTLFVSFLLLTINSCSKKRTIPDVSHIKVNISIQRFEQDIFQSDFEKIEDSIKNFKTKYGEFFEIFNHKIVQLGSTENPAYPALLKGFITDYTMNQLYKKVTKDFPHIDTLENQLAAIFTFYKYYFPNKPVPRIITFISGFNQSMVTTDTIIGIGLDKYLGSKCEYYKRLGIPAYARVNMYKEKIPTDCAKAWALTQFTMSDSSFNLLSNMIYQGKIIYFTQMMVPDANDTILTGLSKHNIEWCEKNENQMWTYLIEKKLLFTSDYLTINKFIQDGPFTKDFGQSSPGRAAVWIGWQIIQSYMDKYPEVSLKELMEDNDFQTILNKAKYKP